jgi:putative hydrolase of the HAD superfamily
MEKKTLVFDLDDTLVREIDYLKSAFAAIAQHLDKDNPTLFSDMFGWHKGKEDVFGHLENRYEHAVKQQLKDFYRNHVPNFDPISQNRDLLIELKNDGHYLGLITDGFSITQRNKIRALDIGHLFDLIVISEEFGSAKPDRRNFEVFSQFDTKQHFYISDNVSKDFIAPNQLGWTTICLLDSGENIHTQDFNKEMLYLPAIKIHDLSELRGIINHQ